MLIPDEPKPGALCILVIDDNETIQRYIRDTLLDEGYQVMTANDGASALDLVGFYHPALILLDMYMPSVDGWAFLAAYPRTPQPHAPIIAMSSDVDVRRLPGVVAGLSKPFTIDGLLNQVNRFLPKAADTDSSDQPDPAATR